MKPLKHTGDSSNIAFYAEDGRSNTRKGDIWCEVLRDLWGERNALGKPNFGFRIYRQGDGQIATYRYWPRQPVKDGRLPDDKVTAIVRRVLRGVQ